MDGSSSSCAQVGAEPGEDGGNGFLSSLSGSGDSDFESFGEHKVLIDGLWLPC